jgi:hypothetical protein
MKLCPGHQPRRITMSHMKLCPVHRGLIAMSGRVAHIEILSCGRRWTSARRLLFPIDGTTDLGGCPKSQKDEPVTGGTAEKSSGGPQMGVDATACQSPFLLSSRYLPYCQRLPLTAHSAGNFSQRANLSLKVCSQSRPAAWRSAPPVRARSPFSGTWLPDSSKQTNYGRTLLPTR